MVEAAAEEAGADEAAAEEAGALEAAGTLMVTPAEPQKDLAYSRVAWMSAALQAV